MGSAKNHDHKLCRISKITGPDTSRLTRSDCCYFPLVSSRFRVLNLRFKNVGLFTSHQNYYVCCASERRRKRKQTIDSSSQVCAVDWESCVWNDVPLSLPTANTRASELFRYLYPDEVNLIGSNAMGVLHLQNKYMLPSLVDKCTEYLRPILNPSQVFKTTCSIACRKRLDCCLLSEGYRSKCIEIRSICYNSKVFCSRNWSKEIFFKSRRSTSSRQWLNGRPNDRKNMQGRQTDGQQIGMILGERIIQAIWFPVMQLDDFISVVGDSKVLTN